MESSEYNLLVSLALIPVVIALQLWVRNRRRSRRNEVGQQEFDSLGDTLVRASRRGSRHLEFISHHLDYGRYIEIPVPMIFNAK